MRPLSPILAYSILAAALYSQPIDRYPELKSRALAWTGMDGSYLVDVNNRAEMQDFYYNVFVAPFPAAQWTGSENPIVPGSISEACRIRNYSQQNAFRALVGSPPVTEDPSWLAKEQAGALCLALNPTRITHFIDSTYVGYSQDASDACASSLIGGFTEAFDPTANSTCDLLITDIGANNAADVGHRNQLLSHATTTATFGTAYNSSLKTFIALWQCPLTFVNLPGTNIKGFSPEDNLPPSEVTAWPPSGFIPLDLVRGLGRWSFRPATNQSEVDFPNAIVTAKLNGVSIPIQNFHFENAILTWEFKRTDMNLADQIGDSSIEITVTGLVINYWDFSKPSLPRKPPIYPVYHYTVNIFDQRNIQNQAATPISPLDNISTRGFVGTGDNVMIAGFNITGTSPIRVAIRSQGPGLQKYGIQNPLQKTHLRLYDSNGKVFGDNISWKQHPDWRLLQSYNVAPSRDDEAGMVATLWPGSYTAILSDDSGTGGVGIIEAFNIDGLSASQLTNLSTRGLIGSGEQIMIAGLIVINTPTTFVIRTQGPSLTRFGLMNVATDTTLTIAREDGSTLATNDDWKADPNNARLSADLSSLAPMDSREAALVLTLQPGSYTALVGNKVGNGIGIVEIFQVSP